jgi:hypothetical protein
MSRGGTPGNHVTVMLPAQEAPLCHEGDARTRCKQRDEPLLDPFRIP